ncbi:acid-sensing ion channel 1-like isoform X1 [Limulus polyphemus]|uniref:Acid-sensing ion channel 1-like isoform X1 n=1 Tax=Limulus polyphemus TaxID=6850 RepID=A0ABM1TQ20_LIMPO|nr:acid-sensing ion channel 1-like isoform X1 [Limulus polyphemus]
MYCSTRERLMTFSTSKLLYLCLVGAVSITSLSFCTYFIKTFLDDYLTYPTVLKVDMDMGEHLTFPAVTICNHNRISISKLEELCFNENYNLNHSICNATFQTILNSPLNMKIPYSTNLFSMAESCSDGDSYYESEPTQLRRPNKVFSCLALPEAQIETTSLQPEEIIKKCVYDGQHCDARNFSKFWTYLHGNCFTFNDQWNNETHDRLVVATGALSGLEILLDKLDESSTDIDITVKGYKVLIHSPNVTPDVENDGVLIEPDSTTYIALEKVCFSSIC